MVFILNVMSIFRERVRENIHKKEKGHNGRGKDRASSILAITECNTTNTKQKRRGEKRRREEEEKRSYLAINQTLVRRFSIFDCARQTPSPFDSTVFLLLYHRPLIRRRDPGQYELRLKLFFS